MKAIKVIRTIAWGIHEKKGQQALYNWADKLNIPFVYCKECDTEAPCVEHECLMCGSTIKKEK